MAALSILHTGNVEHDDKMTEASAHDKQMKDLVGTKEAVSCIEERKFQCVDNSPNGIDNSSCNKPEESCSWKRCDQRRHGQDAEPSHGDIDHGRKPLGTGDPECLDQDTCGGSSPYQD